MKVDEEEEKDKDMITDEEGKSDMGLRARTRRSSQLRAKLLQCNARVQGQKMPGLLNNAPHFMARPTLGPSSLFLISFYPK